MVVVYLAVVVERRLDELLHPEKETLDQFDSVVKMMTKTTAFAVEWGLDQIHPIVDVRDEEMLYRVVVLGTWTQWKRSVPPWEFASWA